MRIHIGVLDILVLNIAVLTSELLFGSQFSHVIQPIYLKFYIFMNIAWVSIGLVFSLYGDCYRVVFEQFCRKTMNVYLCWSFVTLVYLFFWRQVELSPLFISVNIIGFGTLLLFNRFIFLTTTYPKLKQSRIKNVMILGYNDVAKKLAGYLEKEGSRTRFIGFCEEHINIGELTHHPVLGDVTTAIKTSKKHRIDEIYSTILPEADAKVYQVMKEADQACIRFKIVPEIGQIKYENGRLRYMKDMPILSLRSEPLESARNQSRKRVFDFVVSLLITVFILSWLIPIITLFIWLDSGGPIFFVQMRSGKNNQPFPCLKFRSMHADRGREHHQAKRNDPRFTRVGKILRKTNLDEIPQFINVLRGEMSIVGPRPHMLQHTEQYSKLIGQYMVRQFLKPGISGWAQVNGFRGETRTMDQMARRVEHDLWYMENWSLWLDVRIIFMTVVNILRGDQKAY